MGSNPTAMVEKPIRNMQTISTILRPWVSPQWPRKKAPIGRATYPTPYVASDATMAVFGSPLGKKTCGKISDAAVA